MRIFLTGGTGLLGNTVLRQLASDHHVMTLVRGEPDEQVFAGTVTEFVKGDLLQRDVIDAAIAECEAVIHCAGLIHLGWQCLDESMRVNRDGTRVMVDACCKHKVPLVHVGTVNTLATGSRSQVADESTPLDHAGGQIPCSYVVSKRAGVNEVVAGHARNLRSVIIHPGFMLGPWDWKPSSGRMIVEVAKAWRPIAPSGGGSICDSRDVADGTIAAMNRLLEGSIDAGRQYILAGENWTYYELWKAMAKLVGRRSPIMPAGPLQRWVGKTVGDFLSRFSKNESDFNSAAVEMSSQFHWYDSTRANEELGYRSRNANESIEAAVDWLREHGKLP